MANKPGDEGIGLLSGGPPPAPPAETPVTPESSPASAAAPPPSPPSAPSVASAGRVTLKAADEPVREVTAGTVATLSAVLSNGDSSEVVAELSVEIGYASTYPGEGAEWPVSWIPPGKRTWTEIVVPHQKLTLTLGPGSSVPLSFEVTTPVGVRYGDRLEVRLSVRAPNEGAPARVTLACVARQAVLAIKTSRGYEREVADTLLARAEDKPDVLFALLVPSALRGYVFAEGMSFEGVNEMLRGIRKARGLVAGETTLKEVEPLLVPKVTVEGFVEGAIVELVAGPFKGERARVKKIDRGKEEITVELIEAVVPIPVTVRGDHVRMIEKGSGGGASGG